MLAHPGHVTLVSRYTQEKYLNFAAPFALQCVACAFT